MPFDIPDSLATRSAPIRPDSGRTPRVAEPASRRSALLATLALIVASAATCLVTNLTDVSGAFASTSKRAPSLTHNNGLASRCPWLHQWTSHSKSAVALADEVIAKMTLIQKAGFAVLRTAKPVENTNNAVPSLCIPSITLTDGPNGVGAGLGSVTRFPAAIGVAATFNPQLAQLVGAAMGAEARAKGFNVIQGPDLNLARVPLSGRIFETFGEDPALTAAMGVATIRGIQSQGAMADAKHFSGYTQETARPRLSQIVSRRALAELYNAPFEAAVKQAHVASMMCSIGTLNGVNDCANPYIYSTLRSWGFRGFIRSDLRAVRDVALAFRAGLSLLKPGSPAGLASLVKHGYLPVADLDRAVRAVLTEMFTFGMITDPRHLDIYSRADSSAHAALALAAAQNSVVLLKNTGSVLPLSRSVRSVAVIGTDAQTSPVNSGGGSSRVRAPYMVTPLQALRSVLGSTAAISYAPGGPSLLELDRLTNVDLITGTTLPPLVERSVKGEPGKSDLVIDSAKNVTASIATASHFGTGEGWSTWHLEVRAKTSGVFEVGMQEVGDTWLYVNQHLLLASRGVHGPADWSTSVTLRAGHNYTFTAHWFSVAGHGTPRFGIADVTPQINAAVAAARHAKVAIVFAGSLSSEGSDQSNLYLPGDANALISAVASVNRHTIVVLHSGGAVLMPWLSKVQAVLEAWYPGQVDGSAIAPVLTGAVNPSGRLPLTFPASAGRQPVASSAQFPGIGAVVTFGAGLDIGYRWYQVNGVRPLFPFGFGLSYTTFRLSAPSVSRIGSLVRVHVTVTNTGRRAGADVVQAYVNYPNSAGEPPEQLRAFTRVTLAAQHSQVLTLNLAPSSFEVYRGGTFTTVPGTYHVSIGSSSASLPIRLPITLP